MSIVRQCAVALDRMGPSPRTPTPADIVLSDAGDGSGMAASLKDLGSERDSEAERSIGTPNPDFAPYLSPEEVMGGEKDSRSNQFALAVIAYEMLCGKRPFAGGNISQLFYEICASPPQPPSESNPNLPRAVDPVLERALSKFPESRYPSSTALSNALSTALEQARTPVFAPAPVPASVRAETFVPPIAAAATASGRPGAPVAEPVGPAPATGTVAYDLPPARRRTRWDEDDTRPKPSRSLLAESGGQQSGTSKKWIFAAIAAAVILIAAALGWQARPKAHTATSNMGPAAPAIPAATQQPPAQQPSSSVPAPQAAPPSTGAVAVPKSTPGRLVQQSQQSPAAASQQSPVPAGGSVPPTQAPKPNFAQTPAPLPAPHPADRVAPLHAGSGTVDFVTNPPGAQLLIDHNIVCTAPCTLTLPPGRHVLSATLGGYATAERIFHVPEDSSMIIDLAQGAGVLLINSIPAGATVMLDGKEVGHAPMSLHVLAGQHRLDLFSGAQSKQQIVSIQPDTIQGVTLDLRAQ